MYQISLPKIHKEGWLFIGIFAGVTLALALLSTILGYIGLILTGWCAYFFRDPDRVVPINEGLVVSPADGTVHQVVDNAALPPELGLEGEGWTRVSIFLNVFNVHVNRVPIGGKIIKSIYHPGKFLNASLDKASIDNERQALLVETHDNKQIAFSQIAGLIARRIRCDIRERDEVKTGERFGLIRFGSRCDVFLPKGVNALVMPGQKTIAGETILADLSSKTQVNIEGEIR